MNQNTAARAKTIKEEKSKRYVDDKFKLGEFHSVFSEYVYECLNKYNLPSQKLLFERLGMKRRLNNL